MDARSTVCTRHDPTEKTFNMSPDTNHEKDQQSSSIKVLILVRTNPLRTCREKMCEKVPKHTLANFRLLEDSLSSRVGVAASYFM